jgi:hypothetical protein
MPGLVPGIHESSGEQKNVDGRDKPGHDWGWFVSAEATCRFERFALGNLHENREERRCRRP